MPKSPLIVIYPIISHLCFARFQLLGAVRRPAVFTSLQKGRHDALIFQGFHAWWFYWKLIIKTNIFWNDVLHVEFSFCFLKPFSPYFEQTERIKKRCVVTSILQTIGKFASVQYLQLGCFDDKKVAPLMTDSHCHWFWRDDLMTFHLSSPTSLIKPWTLSTNVPTIRRLQARLPDKESDAWIRAGCCQAGVRVFWTHQGVH